jgi:hypothetical protein
VKIDKQKNAVFCLAHAACGGAPDLSVRRLEQMNIFNVRLLCLL